jgi:serine/threonine protein kinase
MERGWFMTEDSVINSAPASDMVAVYATARDIACAMAYVHSKDIIHGDLRGDSLGLASSPQDQRGFIAKVSFCGVWLLSPLCLQHR